MEKNFIFCVHTFRKKTDWDVVIQANKKAALEPCNAAIQSVELRLNCFVAAVPADLT